MGFGWGLGLEAGYYHTNANDLDLDYELIFRSRAFVDYKISTISLVRLELAHLSNARLGNENPGTETLAVNWVIDLPGK
ncbi:MAG: acyloxyacyl hydrolase [Oceanospirillaceae bacterium]|nr:acyloxyacyl hydrolase [Oceanospirillaceae bacterium]